MITYSSISLPYRILCLLLMPQEYGRNPTTFCAPKWWRKSSRRRRATELFFGARIPRIISSWVSLPAPVTSPTMQRNYSKRSLGGVLHFEIISNAISFAEQPSLQHGITRPYSRIFRSKSLKSCLTFILGTLVFSIMWQGSSPTVSLRAGCSGVRKWVTL